MEEILQIFFCLLFLGEQYLPTVASIIDTPITIILLDKMIVAVLY
jgi:hypothetical protein